MARVIKVARKGFDVKTAGDENLLYSSLWPVLSIYKEIPVKITNPTVSVKIADHDLGYSPMFWDFTNYTNTSILPGRSNLLFSNRISVSDHDIQYTGDIFAPTGTIEGVVYLFTLDLSKAYTAPIVKIGGAGGDARSTRGFKLAKEGKSIDSHNLKDFVITTDARSPLIHSVTPATVSGGTIRVEHNLGYVPLYFGYTLQNGYYKLMATGGGASTKFSSSAAAITFTESSDGRQMSIIILKDPFEAQQTGIITV